MCLLLFSATAFQSILYLMTYNYANVIEQYMRSQILNSIDNYHLLGSVKNSVSGN